MASSIDLLLLSTAGYGTFTWILLSASPGSVDFMAGILFLFNSLWLVIATVWSAVTTRISLPAFMATVACLLQILIMMIMLYLDSGTRRDVIMINGTIAGGFFLVALILIPETGTPGCVIRQSLPSAALTPTTLTRGTGRPVIFASALRAAVAGRSAIGQSASQCRALLLAHVRRVTVRSAAYRALRALPSGIATMPGGCLYARESDRIGRVTHSQRDNIRFCAAA